MSSISIFIDTTLENMQINDLNIGIFYLQKIYLELKMMQKPQLDQWRDISGRISIYSIVTATVVVVTRSTVAMDTVAKCLAMGMYGSWVNFEADTSLLRSWFHLWYL